MHIKNCLHSYLKLPVRNKKPYKGKSIAELVAMDIPPTNLIKPKTMAQVKKLLQGMFRFAIDQNYLAQSPVADIKIKSEKTPNRGAFRSLKNKNLLSLKWRLSWVLVCQRLSVIGRRRASHRYFENLVFALSAPSIGAWHRF